MHNGVPVTEILPYAFKDAYNLKNITIPNTITNIAEYAFYGCSSLETAINIPETMDYIPQYMFYGCSKLSSVTIPNSIKTIETYAFYQCESIQQIIIPALTTNIKPYAFYGCTSADVTFVDTTYLWRPNCAAKGTPYNSTVSALLYSFSDKEYAKKCLVGYAVVQCYGSNPNNSSHTTLEAPSTVGFYKTTYKTKPSGYN